MDKPETDLYILDWLNKDDEVWGMKLNIDDLRAATDIPTCMAICNMQYIM